MNTSENTSAQSPGKKRRPLLIIDVDTGENTKGRIEVFKDDEPA